MDNLNTNEGGSHQQLASNPDDQIETPQVTAHPMRTPNINEKLYKIFENKLKKSQVSFT